MITPTINFNGNSIDDLVKPRLTAMDHLMDAIEALKQVTPNGRDYLYMSACHADRAIHYSRMEVLRALREELMREAVYIKEQVQ